MKLSNNVSLIADGRVVAEIKSMELNAQSSQKIPVKTVWVQYMASILDPNSSVHQKRSALRKILDDHNIPYIDTFDPLRQVVKGSSASKDRIWNGHHSPYGNKIVCQTVLEWLGKNSNKPR